MQDSANQLPSECIGSDRLLSRALYRAAVDYTRGERPSVIYRYHPKHSPEILADHIRLLPRHAVDALRDSFAFLANQQQIRRTEGCESISGAVSEPLFAWLDEIPASWVSEILRHLEDDSSADK